MNADKRDINRKRENEEKVLLKEWERSVKSG